MRKDSSNNNGDNTVIINKYMGVVKKKDKRDIYAAYPGAGGRFYFSRERAVRERRASVLFPG